MTKQVMTKKEIYKRIFPMHEMLDIELSSTLREHIIRETYKDAGESWQGSSVKIVVEPSRRLYGLMVILSNSQEALGEI